MLLSFSFLKYPFLKEIAVEISILIEIAAEISMLISHFVYSCLFCLSSASYSLYFRGVPENKGSILMKMWIIILLLISGHFK